LKKKILISVGIAIFALIITWTIFYLIFPVIIIDNIAYNKNKIKYLNHQREKDYNELYAFFHDELNKIIINQYLIYNKNNNDIYGIERNIIYNGDISAFDKINEYGILYLTKEELRILRNTIFAKYGYIFQSRDLIEHFNKFTWYVPQYNNVDEKLTRNDKYLIEIIRKIENEQLVMNIQGLLDIFYDKTMYIDETYYNLMNKYMNNIKFPMQNISYYLLNDIFPPYINVIKYNDQYYNEFVLKLFMEYYNDIVINIIEQKTNIFIDYIDHYLNYSEINISEYNSEFNKNIYEYILNQCLITKNIIDKIKFELSEKLYYDVSVINIDGINYSLEAVNQLQYSMTYISSYLLNNIKYIFIDGINYQTKIYTNNIDDYINWYYSAFTSIDRRITNIIGFFSGDKVSEEMFYINNFNRIMNNNTSFDDIIIDDMSKIIDIIHEIYNNYFDLLEYFYIDNKQNNSIEIITNEIFINPFINNIILYFEHIFEALDNANNFNYQDFRINSNVIVGTAMTAVKLASNFSFLGGLAFDFLSLQTQRLLKSSELRQQLLDKMIENQNNKIEIINDPINFLYNRLNIGSVLFVDNYFIGLNTYQHYGVYIGNGNVIHFAPLEGQEISAENGIIHETTLDKFLNGRALQIEPNINIMFTEYEIIQRAMSRIGEKGYNLFTNNCEHFARWCVTGEHISYQINNIPQKIDNTLLIIRDNYNTISKFFELFN